MSDLPSLVNSSTPLDVPAPSCTKVNVTESASLPLTSNKRPNPEPTTTTTIANASATTSRAKRSRANVKHRNGKGPSRRMATAAVASSARPSAGLELTNVSSDLCAACGAAGLYVCCDGCPRVFHPFCLEPPLAGVEEAGEHWYCRECDASQDRQPPIPSTSTGIFSALIQQQHNKNPKTFKLPEGLRNRYENVATNPYTGDFVDQSRIKAKKKVDGVKGYVEDSHPYQIKTRDGKTILCYACGLGASVAKRLKILGCDECDQYFHLDCLDPPLVAPPPSTVKWMCPLHAAKAAPSRRFPKESVTAQVTEPHTANNGDIDVIVSSQRRIKPKNVEELVINRVRYQVPENIIILDFWSKISGSDHASTTEALRLPVLGQDILPTSAATSEDASTSPSKVNDVVLGQHALGCSILGDASQPSSRSSSPEPHISSQPNLSCLLQAASAVADVDSALNDSGPNLSGDATSTQTSSQIVDKKPQPRRRARISTPRVGTRGSSRLANASAVNSTPNLSAPNQASTIEATKFDSAIATRTAPSLTVFQVGQTNGPSPTEATHSPSMSGTPIPIYRVTNKPRGSSSLVPQNKYPPVTDDINVAVSGASRAAIESSKSPKPSHHPSDQDTDDADTDDSLFSKAPTRIRIKGTKYVEQPARSPSSQEFTMPQYLEQFYNRYASDPPSPPKSKHTQQGSSAGRSKPFKDTTPRPRHVKRPSDATATNSKTVARPSAMISSDLRPESSIIPVKRKQQKAPVGNSTESGITSVELRSGASTKLQPPQDPLPGTSSLTRDTFPHKASSTNGTTRPRKKARRDDYSVDTATKDSHLKRVDDNPQKLCPTEENLGMSVAARPDAISEPKLTNPKPSTSKPTEPSFIHLPPLANPSTLPKKASRPANAKKRIVSAPLSSVDRPIEGPQIPKMILKLPARSAVPTADKIDNALPVNSAVQLSASAGANGKSISTPAPASGLTSQRALSRDGSFTSSLSRPNAMASSLDGAKFLSPPQPSSSKTKTKHPSVASSPYSIQHPSPPYERASFKIKTKRPSVAKLTASSKASIQASTTSHPLTLEGVISRHNLLNSGSGSGESSARPTLASPPVESSSGSSQPKRPATKAKRPSAAPLTISPKPTTQKNHLSQNLPTFASPLSHQIQPEPSGSKATTSKVTKTKVRKRVSSTTDPSNSRDLISDNTSLASVVTSQTPNPQSMTTSKASTVTLSPHATTSLATETSSPTKQEGSTELAPVRTKKFKIKVPTANSPSNSTPQTTAIISTSLNELSKTTASQSTPTIIAHPQNRLPFVPHPQHPTSLPPNFVPHPQYPIAFVAHPQHTPVQIVRPDGFVAHPQYPLKIFKNIPPSSIGSGSAPNKDHQEPEGTPGDTANGSADPPNGVHQLEFPSTS